MKHLEALVIPLVFLAVACSAAKPRAPIAPSDEGQEGALVPVDSCESLPEPSSNWPDPTLAHYKLCEQDRWQNCTTLGWRLRTGSKGVEKDLQAALAFLQCSCSKGNLPGCNAVGTMYERGDGVPLDQERASRIYRHVCELENGDGCSNLGNQLEHGSFADPDPEEAAVYYKRACDLDDGHCAALGYLYDRGLGVERDLEKAIALYERACPAGSATACSNLGVAYERGEGRPKNHEKALELYDKACTPEYPPGCNTLGLMYQNGRGTPLDLKRAALSFQRGCDAWQEKGRVEACMRMGHLSEQEGLDLAPPEEIAQHFERACDEGFKHGCGQMTRHLLGKKPPQVEQATIFAKRACDLGLQSGCVVVQRLTSLGD